MKYKDLEELEQTIGYHFKNKSLLNLAVTHSSFLNENRSEKITSNERIEFLGDAVLELSVSDYLYKHYPHKSEGDMTKMRASIVCEYTLNLCAKKIYLGSYLRLGKGEEMTGGRNRPSIMSDAIESVIGAIYLDGGFDNAKEFVDNFVLTDVENQQLFFDSKTILQEIVQGKSKDAIRYELTKEEGPAHNKSYYVSAWIGSKKMGEGFGKTKKAAEMEAAYHAILNIRGLDR